MVKNFVALPDEKIREKSTEVLAFDKSLEKIITDLTDTLEIQHDPPGLGLAAPQIGYFKRVFVARIRNKIKAFVNPKIIKTSPKEGPFLEGCFSVTSHYGHVTRPTEIDIETQDKHGKTIKTHLKGLPARIFQHEIDHLNGILFVDHIYSQNGKLFKVEKDKKGKEYFVEIKYA